jgi:hypothetical protein
VSTVRPSRHKTEKAYRSYRSGKPSTLHKLLREGFTVMKENSTPAPQRGKVSSLYRLGDTIVFKYEGNVRARVTGHQVIGGKVWVEAHAADIDFLVPLRHVVGVEPKEEG